MATTPSPQAGMAELANDPASLARVEAAIDYLGAQPGWDENKAIAYVQPRVDREGDMRDTRTLISERHPRSLMHVPAARLNPV